MTSNLESRRSRTWLHSKRAPAPLDAHKVEDKHRFHRYDEQSADGNGTGADAEASPLIIIPDNGLGGPSLEAPGPAEIASLSDPSLSLSSDGVPTETSSDGVPAETFSVATAITSPTPSIASIADSSSAAQPTGPAVVAVGSLATAHSSIPGVAIGLVVAALVIALMAVIVFIVRRRSIRAREQKRQTWNRNIFTKQQEARAEQEKVFTVEQPAPAYEEIVAPPMSYNAILPPSQAMFSARPASEATSVSTATTRRSLTHPAPPPMPSAPLTTPASTAASVNTSREEATRANICCTFIPCLPDELSISTGETVRVLARYDDGWAMCVNGTGEQGMVPTECLDNGNGRIGSGDWRASRRVSSLPRSRF